MILIIRILVGWMYFHAGFVKLFKKKKEQTIFFENSGLKPAIFYLYFIGILELVGGILIGFGLYNKIICPILGLIIIGSSIIKYIKPQSLRSDVEFYILWALVTFWLGSI